MKIKESLVSCSAALGRGLLYGYMYIMFRPKLCYESRKAKEEIKKGGVILVGNHVGHNDGQMFYMLFRRKGNFTVVIQKKLPVILLLIG